MKVVARPQQPQANDKIVVYLRRSLSRAHCLQTKKAACATFFIVFDKLLAPGLIGINQAIGRTIVAADFAIAIQLRQNFAGQLFA